ncbi:transglutaminase family protein [Sphingomonas sp. ID0503]|uniref:transglutaminase family protein n=1 Tax=Sphingomonas sp. ID0503 TaxID=3399691 RepID=UPI003AFA17F5
MPNLIIHHVTLYSYSQPVSFGEHRIMVRPREGHDQWLTEARLDIDPAPAAIRQIHDVFGNSVTIARFDRPATQLSIESTIRMEHHPLESHAVQIEDYAKLYPFTYSSEDMPDLLRSIERVNHDPWRMIDDWADGFVRRDGPTDTLAMLTAITAAICRDFTYVPRQEKGTQTPLETLRLGQGTCRDFAVLMIEAVRALGFAARFVSGYVYNPAIGDGNVGGGNTHAWVRIFLPGEGWVEFDPTNGIVGNRGLVRVAIARDPYQAVPISGTYSGLPESFTGMTVSVEVDLEAEPTSARSAPSTTEQSAIPAAHGA